MNTNLTEDITFAIKDKHNCYYTGYNQWDKQLRKAKLYHSYKYAEDIKNDKRFKEHDAHIVKVLITEVE